jgi:diaminopimelate decarboxylase
LNAGADAADLSYGNTIKKSRDIAYAHSCGVAMYTVDVRAELDKVLTHAPGSDVCVRLFHEGAGADWPLSRKFGCAEPEALELLTVAHRAGSCTGLSFHVGSQQRDIGAWDNVLARWPTCSPASTTATRHQPREPRRRPRHYRNPSYHCAATPTPSTRPQQILR